MKTIYHFETENIYPTEELKHMAKFYSSMIEKHGVIISNPSIKLKEVIEVSDLEWEKKKKEEEEEELKKSVDIKPCGSHEAFPGFWFLRDI